MCKHDKSIQWLGYFGCTANLKAYEPTGNKYAGQASTSLKAAISNMQSIQGKGKLTAGLIKKLQIYFTRAIRSNQNSNEDMRKAIFATLKHCN